MRVIFGLLVLLIASPGFGSRELNYGALEGSVATAVHADGVEVAVSLHLKRSLFDKNTRCFKASDGLVVRLNGQPMTLAFEGGPARPTAISGVAMLPNGCAPPAWRARLPARQGPATIEFALNGGVGRMVVEDLLAKRVLAVPKGAPIRSGGPLALRWMPAGDLWNGPNAQVTVYQSGQSPKNAPGTRGADGMIRFTLSKVATGPAQIDVRPQHPVRPRISTCTLGQCTVGAVTGMPVDVTVVP